MVSISILMLIIAIVAAIRKLIKCSLPSDKKLLWGLVIFVIPFFGSIFFLSYIANKS